MAFTKQAVTVTKPDADTVAIAIGVAVYYVPIDTLRDIQNGLRPIAFLLGQFVQVLQAAGVNPNTATAAQIKNAIEAQTYWWGN